MIRPITAFGAAIVFGMLASCSHEPSGPTAAMLNVNLTAPDRNDGAVLFTISGGPVDSVEASGHVLYSAQVDPNTLRVIVTGNLGSGTIARIRIADERQLSRYSVVIHQVATRPTYSQREPAIYSLVLTR